MQIKVTDKQFSMNELLMKNLDILIKAVDRKWDGLLLFDGVEGSGKTTLAKQVSYYEAYKNKSDFNLNHVTFTAKEFMEAVDNAKKKTPILWDEAVFGALGTEWATTINRTIEKMFVTIRKKQLFINIVIPWFYMLRPYLAVGRTRALIHIITPDGLRRGFFKFYDYGGKQSLYFKNKKYYNYFGVKEIFKGTFPQADNLFYSEKEYDDKKDAAIKELLGTERPKVREEQLTQQRDAAIRGWGMYTKASEIVLATGIGYRQIRTIITGVKR